MSEREIITKNGRPVAVVVPIAEWQRKARGPVTGHALASGHYIPEEVPEALLEDMLGFFR